ncbi:MAG: hypothetical protein RPT00_02640 [Gammaproteobacteria bacterium]
MKIKKNLFRFLPKDILMLVRFEYLSKVGRFFSKRLKVDKERMNYVHLGCGNTYIEEMINIDFFSNQNKDYGLDLRYPFKIDSDCIDGIFCEHTFEHLSHSEIKNSLAECYRILKQGSKIRVIVPDMSIFIKKYYEDDEEWFQKWKVEVLGFPSRLHMCEYYTKLFALNFTSNFYGHKSSWDFETGKFFLEKAGFSNIKKFAANEGSCELLFDSGKESRQMLSLYIEGEKLT